MIERLKKEVDILERHLQVLKMVLRNEPIGIVKTSNETGYPHHKVRYSLRAPEQANLIKPTGKGAVTTERTESFITEISDKLTEINNPINMMKMSEDLALVLPDWGEFGGRNRSFRNRLPCGGEYLLCLPELVVVDVEVDPIDVVIVPGHFEELSVETPVPRPS